MKPKADHSKSSQAVYQWAPRLCRPGSDGSHWIAIISILVAVVLFYRWSGLDARSRNELAENMNVCLSFALQDVRVIQNAMQEGDNMPSMSARVSGYLSEFGRHHRAYAAIHWKGVPDAELSNVIMFYDDVARWINSQIRSSTAADTTDSYDAALLDLVESLRDDLRVLVHGLSEETIASWHNERRAAATVHAVVQGLKLYGSFNFEPIGTSP